MSLNVQIFHPTHSFIQFNNISISNHFIFSIICLVMYFGSKMRIAESHRMNESTILPQHWCWIMRWFPCFWFNGGVLQQIFMGRKKFCTWPLNMTKLFWRIGNDCGFTLNSYGGILNYSLNMEQFRWEWRLLKKKDCDSLYKCTYCIC